MKLLTNSDVKKPYDCLEMGHGVYFDGLGLAAPGLSSSFCSPVF